MSWYWIVLIVIGYILLSAVACVVLSRTMKTTDNAIIVLFGMFWPLFIISLPIIILMILLNKIIDKYGYKEE